MGVINATALTTPRIEILKRQQAMTHTQNPLLQPYAGHSPKDTASLVWGGMSLALLVAALCSDSVTLIIATLINAALAVRAMTRVDIGE